MVLFYYINHQNYDDQLRSLDQQINLYTQSTQKNKKEKNLQLSYVEILKKLNQLVVANGVNVEHISLKENINLKFYANEYNVIRTLGLIDSIFYIVQFELIPDHEQLIANVMIDKKRYNPEHNESSIRTYSADRFQLSLKTLENQIDPLPPKKLDNLVLKGVINDEVLINNQWLSKNQTIDQYKILEINLNSVQLQHAKTGQIITLKVFKDE